MKLSAPIHVLKAKAQELRKQNSISNTDALNLIAKSEGYNSWSLLHSEHRDGFPSSYDGILDYFNPGDLVLIGARPSKGKTIFAIGIFVQAIQKQQAKNYCFSLSEVHRDIAGRMAIYDESIGGSNKFFELDYSNDINADYIIKKTQKDISKGSLILIDYLQLLDEKRTNPDLQKQIETLKLYAKEKGCVIIFLSQLDREIENRVNKKPIVEDVRMPNPFDLKIFNKLMLLYKESEKQNEVEVLFYRPKEFSLKVSWDKTLKFNNI
jgi:replicative DNA helicase